MALTIKDDGEANSEAQSIKKYISEAIVRIDQIENDFHTYEELSAAYADLSTLLGVASDAAGKLSTYFDDLNTKKSAGGRP